MEGPAGKLSLPNVNITSKVNIFPFGHFEFEAHYSFPQPAPSQSDDEYRFPVGTVISPVIIYPVSHTINISNTIVG
jgi:hypothetical protein